MELYATKMLMTHLLAYLILCHNNMKMLDRRKKEQHCGRAKPDTEDTPDTDSPDADKAASKA